MNALIIYDTFDFAIRAKATLERVTQQTDETTHWSINLWRADVLMLPPASAAALAEAMEAHLIMFAVSHIQSLLQSLLDWLERWAGGRRIREAALAVWNGHGTDKSLAQIPQELSRFAQRHGLSLLCHRNPPAEDESSKYVRQLHNREVSLTPTLRHILGQSV